MAACSIAIAAATHSSFLSRTSQLFFLHTRKKNGFTSFFLPFSSSIAVTSTPKKKSWSRPVISALELDGVKIAKEDTIFSKLGMQLHRRDQHPLGILKNVIYEYFDANYSNKFDKFDDLCPLVSVKQMLASYEAK
ncbi:hypothetical protein Tsubulata_023477 [Turnera subulata]|uniref:Phenylalanine--tRNA ligase n=1 Tax=Turnera subulata TaxID=218843 RepID=A0A9Q0J0D4_9ROSI|nr:hypothetical protein Tsubulata_023477 [Turnera subulata]